MSLRLCPVVGNECSDDNNLFLNRKALRTPGQHILSFSEEKLLFRERGGDLGSEVPYKDTRDIENGDARTSFHVHLI